ncbi:flagellar protein [Enterovibrio norvegicus FF-33]|uniref:rod-binding protein n=1 Tax=Enterovibrio norvegicus TaxID=188144 RepID=UPI000311DA48|nr:rod-binding protein [Enterovibrio norvegicus]OEE70374.1 flagellar protein [Enterovibrio norvegicus FF-33]
MKVEGLHDQTRMSSMLYHDNSALAKIKHSADQQGALKEVAGQFEAMFLQLVLRQMRSSSDVLADEDSPFSSQQYGVFRDMYDGQLAIEMSRKQSAGIADMLVKQLGPAAMQANGVSLQGSVEQRAAKTKADANVIALSKIGINSDGMKETHNLAANDEFCVIKAEARSQAHIAPNFNRCNSLNNADVNVASVNQQRNDVGTTTAFSQPLIRKMEL